MKILVTGGSGYIGSVLYEMLKDLDEEVIVYDRLLYGGDADIIADIRDVNTMIPAIDSCDAVIHLAALSMDLLSDMNPSHTWEINYQANEMISKLLRNTGKRVIYASSGSVYGVREGVSDEDTVLRPLTPYAKTKALSEECFLHKDIDSVVLRFSTAYGASPSQRLDTVVNHMIATAYFNKRIEVNGSNRYRAVMHVRDIARGIITALYTKDNKHRVYNLGSDDQNLKIGDIGQIIHEYIPDSELITDDSSLDKRSYIISYDRIKEDLNFIADFSIKDAIEDLYKSFDGGLITDLDEPSCYRIKYLKEYGSL